MAERTATTAGKNSPSPDQSKGTRSLSLRLRGMRSRPAIMPSTPKGTLTMKMRRQPPAARSSPPMEGPRARPTAWAAPWIPIALPERSPGDRNHDDGDAVGLEHGGTDCLEDPERDEGAEARGEATEGRADTKMANP